MDKIKVLVADDSFFMRKVITDLLQSDPQIEVVGDSSNGEDVLKKIVELKPDVVTLDYDMPKKNGLDTLKALMKLPHHPNVIVVSGYVQDGATITLKFLEEGAIDFILKPSGALSLNMSKVREQLVEKIKVAAKVGVRTTLRHKHREQSLQFNINEGGVVIGSSTGGPAALHVLLPQFPEHFPLPIFVAQHIPKEFTKSLAERLSADCNLQVVEAEDGMEVKKGTIYLAPGGANMELTGNLTKIIVRITDSQDLELPSVNKLMKSVAKIYKENTIGIVLTGMGKDGSLGMEEIKSYGGKTLVQDESTSVVFGMGREVVERGFADDIVPLDQIVQKISDILT